jgi:hypothetical protein
MIRFKVSQIRAAATFRPLQVLAISCCPFFLGPEVVISAPGAARVSRAALNVCGAPAASGRTRRIADKPNRTNATF